MKFLITVRNATGARTYPAIGNRDALMDAAYADGALSVTILVQP
ncbi:hypothetical protein [Massilia hydrophila]|nr:hypothetical protein [Massilia oculi]